MDVWVIPYGGYSNAETIAAKAAELYSQLSTPRIVAELDRDVCPFLVNYSWDPSGAMEFPPDLQQQLLPDGAEMFGFGVKVRFLCLLTCFAFSLQLLVTTPRHLSCDQS